VQKSVEFFLLLDLPIGKFSLEHGTNVHNSWTTRTPI
jgi:hypothetical protein